MGRTGTSPARTVIEVKVSPDLRTATLPSPIRLGFYSPACLNSMSATAPDTIPASAASCPPAAASVGLTV